MVKASTTKDETKPDEAPAASESQTENAPPAPGTPGVDGNVGAFDNAATNEALAQREAEARAAIEHAQSIEAALLSALNLPAGTDPETVSKLVATLKADVEAANNAPDPAYDRDLRSLQRDQQTLPQEPRSAVAQMAAAVQDEQASVDAAAARDQAARMAMDSTPMRLGGDVRFADTAQDVTPERFRISPMGAQAFMPVNAHDIRMAMQSEADMMARQIAKIDRPNVFRIPVLSPSSGALMGYEWRTGSGELVEAPAEANA